MPMAPTTPEPRIAFLVGGVQKAGTSALAQYLRASPGLRLPADKEAHVFDGPDFDGHQVDFFDMMTRLRRYKGEEHAALVHWEEACNLQKSIDAKKGKGEGGKAKGKAAHA